MVRRSNASKTKGIQRGIRRDAITKKVNVIRRSSAQWIIALELWMETWVNLAYDTVLRVCFNLNLVPFTRNSEGLYIVKPKKQVLAYNFYKAMAGLIMIYRVGVTIKLFSQGEMTSSTLLTIVASLSYADSWIISVHDASETVILLNNFKMILKYLQTQRRQEFRTFADLRLSMKAFSTIVMMVLCIIVIAVVNVMLFGGLPTSWLWIAEGWINTSSVDRIWWQLLFLPLEILTIFPLLLTACPVCVSTLISFHISKLIGEEIRSIHVVDKASREKVERMYVCWQLYEKMARPWIVTHLICIVVGISCSATVFIFMAIKYTNLPILLYSLVAVMGPGFIVILALGLYDAVMVSQLSGSVLAGQLTDLRAAGLRNMQLKTRSELVRRLKALRPISIPVGSFTDITYSVMVAIWEEILNQLVFLLSM